MSTALDPRRCAIVESEANGHLAHPASAIPFSSSADGIGRTSARTSVGETVAQTIVHLAEYDRLGATPPAGPPGAHSRRVPGGSIVHDEARNLAVTRRRSSESEVTAGTARAD